MICRNCNSEIGSATFCPNCGARAGSVQYCNACGEPVPAGAHTCPNCGKPVPAVKSRDGSLRRRQRRDGEVRTGFQTLVCLICGIAGLVLLGVITYITLMGNLFVANLETGAQVMNPLDPVGNELKDGSFALVSNVEAFINYFMALPERFTVGFSDPEQILPGIGGVIGIVPEMLMVALLLISVVITALATVVAVFRFIIGMCSKRYFTLVSPLAWVLSAQLMLYLVCVFRGLGGWLSLSSGVMLNLLLSAGGVVICIVSNILFAGNRFLKVGSAVKFISNAGIVAGAVVSLFAFPMAITSVWDASLGNELLNAVIGYFYMGELTMPNFAIIAALLLLIVIYIVTLPKFVRVTVTRLGKTFKFDGYEDTGFVGKSIIHLVSVLLVPAGAIVYLMMFGGADMSAVNTGLYVFAAGGVISLVSAIVNRVFLNKDQLA